MKILELEQRTDAWHQARLGRVGGSDVDAMLSTIKNGEAAARRDLRMRLVCERLTGRVPESGYVNAEMQRGIEMEPIARAVYEAETGAMVQAIGYVQHDELMAGYSPDGFVGADGIIEVKCPKTATHLKYLREDRVPLDYLGQCKHALWITGRAWIDFISFDDRLPDALAFFCVRLTRSTPEIDEASDDEISTYDRKIKDFLSSVDAELEALQTLADLRGRLTMAVGA